MLIEQHYFQCGIYAWDVSHDRPKMRINQRNIKHFITLFVKYFANVSFNINSVITQHTRKFVENYSNGKLS